MNKDSYQNYMHGEKNPTLVSGSLPTANTEDCLTSVFGVNTPGWMWILSFAVCLILRIYKDQSEGPTRTKFHFIIVFSKQNHFYSV